MLTNPHPSQTQRASMLLLGATLAFAGITHLTVARKAFRAQVPPWLPVDTDTVVVVSGAAEIALGSALILAPKKYRELTGCVAAGFFAAIFPGNIAQYRRRRNAFGLDTDNKRFVRLFFQPALIAWALWSSGATDRS